MIMMADSAACSVPVSARKRNSEIPTCASKWRISDMNRLSMFYKLAQEERSEDLGLGDGSPSSSRPTAAGAGGSRGSSALPIPMYKCFFQYFGKIRQDDGGGSWWDSLDQFISRCKALHSGKLLLNVSPDTSNQLYEMFRCGQVLEKNGIVMWEVINSVSDLLLNTSIRRNKAKTAGKPEEYER
jgi:hypothetical protein